ncbi:hypothetical protein C5915_004834 [Escherichia coli O174:H7]|nr:hypothetical protein [Escherichia coli O174:H7]
MGAIDRNDLTRMLILRRHWLPGEDDSPQSLAAAVWLDNHYWENMGIAVNNGIIRAFKGS